jgi:Flp pilus assembly protein TadD
MGKHELADKQLLLILESDPNDATANNDLGYVWADRNKNLDEAERMIRKAIELDKQQRSGGTSLDPDADKDNAAYVDSLGWVLFRKGKVNEARRELEKAAALPSGDEDPVVWDHLGDVLFRLNDKPKAKAMWEKAKEMYEADARVSSRGRRDGRLDEVKRKLARIP